MSASLGVSDRPGWEVATVLVTVKAYPVIGQRTGESVCVAGVRLDGDVPEWIRLFPVPFRSLKPSQKFDKYAIVQLRVQRTNGSDRRPETRRPDLDSLRVGETLSSDHGWAKRWERLGSLVGDATACGLLAGAKQSNQDAPSLGLVKPSRVDAVVVEDNPRFRRDQGGPQVQVDLFGDETEVLEAQPFDVKLAYRCAEASCKGHEQTVIDWETGQLGRKMLAQHGNSQRAKDQVRKKYDQMCGPDRDTYLYLGNQHQHPRSFLVLGLFWPPAGSRPPQALF